MKFKWYFAIAMLGIFPGSCSKDSPTATNPAPVCHLTAVSEDFDIGASDTTLLSYNADGSLSRLDNNSYIIKYSYQGNKIFLALSSADTQYNYNTPFEFDTTTVNSHGLISRVVKYGITQSGHFHTSTNYSYANDTVLQSSFDSTYYLLTYHSPTLVIGPVTYYTFTNGDLTDQTTEGLTPLHYTYYPDKPLKYFDRDSYSWLISYGGIPYKNKHLIKSMNNAVEYFYTQDNEGKILSETEGKLIHHFTYECQ